MCSVEDGTEVPRLLHCSNEIVACEFWCCAYFHTREHALEYVSREAILLRLGFDEMQGIGERLYVGVEEKYVVGAQYFIKRV